MSAALGSSSYIAVEGDLCVVPHVFVAKGLPAVSAGACEWAWGGVGRIQFPSVVSLGLRASARAAWQRQHGLWVRATHVQCTHPAPAVVPSREDGKLG